MPKEELSGFGWLEKELEKDRREKEEQRQAQQEQQRSFSRRLAERRGMRPETHRGRDSTSATALLYRSRRESFRREITLPFRIITRAQGRAQIRQTGGATKDLKAVREAVGRQLFPWRLCSVSSQVW